MMKPLKVYEVNNYIKRMFAGDIILSNIQIEGEISNFKHHYSGHMYFTMKDDKAKIRCVMFRSDNEYLSLKLEDGLKVVASGYISVYDREGDYQLYVRSIKEAGLGDLHKAFEELKKKLEKEGLFDQKYKKDLPQMPSKIGIVTSSTGAAIRDIITIIRRRFPSCELIIYPTLVQGPNAPREICDGLKYLDSRGDIDIIITGRGGGSMEELFAFNDEDLARTIFSLKTPVISAVGHETDFTIADFVADLRAPTPSAAAEMAVPDMEYLLNILSTKYERLVNSFLRWKNNYHKELDVLEKNLRYNNPINKLRDRKQMIDYLFKDICNAFERRIIGEYRKLDKLQNQIQLFDPNIFLDKGYGILLNEYGEAIKSIRGISKNDKIKILLKDGTISTLVIDVNEGGIEYGGE